MKFTQFLRPDGRKRTIEIERSKDVEILAERILAKGLKFEIEELNDGTISMTVSNEDEDLFIRLCKNGPDVGHNVDQLVREAASA